MQHMPTHDKSSFEYFLHLNLRPSYNDLSSLIDVDTSQFLFILWEYYIIYIILYIILYYTYSEYIIYYMYIRMVFGQFEYVCVKINFERKFCC